MTSAMKIHAKIDNGIADIRIRIMHPMETGMRTDRSGKLIPANFIQSLTVTVGGKRVIEGQIGASVSRNPRFGFKVRGAKAGEKVVVSWQDNKGETGTGEAPVEP